MSTFSPIYNQGLAYFFGKITASDHSADQEGVAYDRAYNCFRQAYHEGDMNAGWMLARCYCYGYGVAQDYQQVFKIARELHNHAYPGAGYFLALAYENGWGVDIDLNKVSQIAEQYLELCYDAEGQAGLDESIRQECLMLLIPSDQMNEQELDAFYSDYMERSRFPLRYAVYAEYLINKNPQEHREEIFKLLETGCDEHDPVAQYSLGRILSTEDHPLNAYDMQQGRKLLIKSGLAYLTLAQLAAQEGDLEMQSRLFDLYLEQSRYGYSLIRHENELSCSIHCEPNTWSGIIRVYDNRLTRSLLKHQAMGECVSEAPPRIRLTGIEKGIELTLRVRSAVDDLDRSFTLIPAETTLVIDLMSEHGILWSHDLDLELSSQRGYTRLLISAAALQMAFPFTPPPIVLSWTKRMLRGYALQLFPVDEKSSQLTLRFPDARQTQLITVPEKGFVEIGRSFLHGGEKFHMLEPYLIECEGYMPCVCILVPPPRKGQILDYSLILNTIRKYI